MMEYEPEQMTPQLAQLCEAGGMWEEAATAWSHLARPARARHAWTQAATGHPRRGDLPEAACCFKLAGDPDRASAVRVQDAELRRGGAIR